MLFKLQRCSKVTTFEFEQGCLCLCLVGLSYDISKTNKN